MKNADTSVLVRFAYTRDAAGNPISIQRESGLGVFYYQYDALQRLTYEGQSMGSLLRLRELLPATTRPATARPSTRSRAAPRRCSTTPTTRPTS